jgi:alpha-D-ribose 1-methylphosphonate 5-triphosphate synthase subunit PhnI
MAVVALAEIKQLIAERAEGAAVDPAAAQVTVAAVVEAMAHAVEKLMALAVMVSRQSSGPCINTRVL